MMGEYEPRIIDDPPRELTPGMLKKLEEMESPIGDVPMMATYPCKECGGSKKTINPTCLEMNCEKPMEIDCPGCCSKPES